MQTIQKYISFIVIILVIILGAFLVLKGEKANAPADTWTSDVQVVELKDIATTPDKTEVKPNINNTQTNLIKEQQDFLVKLQKAVDTRDFETFASVLQEVYKNQWSKIKEFEKTESKLYVYATDTYWVKGDLENSLRVSTIVYNKVSEAWRFRYLRIVTLEKYGRNAFNAGDLKTAEGYANQILQMMYRPEGANLLADVYISKINTSIKDGNTTLAKQNLGFIWDFEVSADRRATLTDLKTQLGM